MAANRTHAQQQTSRSPLKECLSDRHTLGRMLLLFFSVSAGGGVLFFSSQVYTGVFLKTVVHMDPVTVGSLSVAATLALFPLTYLAGALSDRWGRRPVVLSGLLLGVLAIMPVYAGLQTTATHWPLALALMLLLVVAVALVTGPQTALLSELFPARTRYTAVGLPHNLAAGWIGGLTPYMVNLIAGQTGVPLHGLLYPTGLLLIAWVVAYVYLPETRGTDLHA
jgi:MFS family permease